MRDQQLVELLLEPAEPMVVLVGEPIYPMSDAFKQAFNSPGYTDKVPIIAKFERIEHYIDASKAAGRNLADCVMFLDLPTNASNLPNLLGLACRASPRLLLVQHYLAESAEKLCDDGLFFAYGFRVLEKTAEPGPQKALYAYSLSDYKQAPDWLNARFWAHPERFSVQE